MIEDKTWKSYQVGQLNYRQRCLWIGLISTADDQGRGHAHPGILRGAIFPYDDLTNDELQADIDALASLGLIIVYQGDNAQPLYQIANWWRYQRPTWAWPSDLPAPEGWTDREKYRRGNEVIQSQWEHDGGLESLRDDPTVTPERGHDDLSVSQAPSGRYRDRGRDRESGSDEDEDVNAFALYQQAGGVLNPLMAEQLGDLVDEYEAHRQGLPPPANGADLSGDEWVQAAIRQAAASSDGRGISVNFIKAILDRWRREGFQAPMKGKKNKGRRDPDDPKDRQKYKAWVGGL